jgi:hypothetical protein
VLTADQLGHADFNDRRAEFCALLVGEAHETWSDAVAEVR